MRFEALAQAGHIKDRRRPMNRRILILPAVLLALLCRASPVTAETVDLRILAINDFHGNLRPPLGGIRIADPDDKSKQITVPAGGAEHMATLVKELRLGRRTRPLSRPAI
jgi:5'-nucleotidase